MKRIILGPDELRFELKMATRNFGKRLVDDLHRPERQERALELILELIALRLEKLEIVREVPDQVIPISIYAEARRLGTVPPREDEVSPSPDTATNDPR